VPPAERSAWRERQRGFLPADRTERQPLRSEAARQARACRPVGWLVQKALPEGPKSEKGENCEKGENLFSNCLILICLQTVLAIRKMSTWAKVGQNAPLANCTPRATKTRTTEGDTLQALASTSRRTHVESNQGSEGCGRVSSTPPRRWEANQL
jgi:hypothetical protein